MISALFGTEGPNRSKKFLLNIAQNLTMSAETGTAIIVPAKNNNRGKNNNIVLDIVKFCAMFTCSSRRVQKRCKRMNVKRRWDET